MRFDHAKTALGIFETTRFRTIFLVRLWSPLNLSAFILFALIEPAFILGHPRDYHATRRRCCCYEAGVPVAELLDKTRYRYICMQANHFNAPVFYIILQKGAETVLIIADGQTGNHRK